MLSNDMSSKCTIHNNNFMVVLYAISIIVQHSPAEPRNFSVDDSSAVLRVRTTNLVPQTSLIKVARICFQIFPRKSNDPLPILRDVMSPPTLDLWYAHAAQRYGG